MPNHVHFIMTPSTEDGLRATFAKARRRYPGRTHQRVGWTGHLWQARFASVVMDEAHLMAAARYADEPGASGLVTAPQDGPWSSARAHQTGIDDRVVDVALLRERIDDFGSFLSAP